MKIQIVALMSLILVGCGNGGDSVTYVVNEDSTVTTLPATECPTTNTDEDETVIIVHDNHGHAHECKPKKGHCHVE